MVPTRWAKIGTEGANLVGCNKLIFAAEQTIVLNAYCRGLNHAEALRCTLKYQLIENTSDGFVTHAADSAELALSLWYALDGDVQSIKNEQRQELSLSDLRTAAEYEKALKTNS